MNDTPLKEYDPQSMIDQINTDNIAEESLQNHIKITKSDPYGVDKPTGGETWQTKANAKNAVPRYMSPAELAHMRLDKLEQSLLRGITDLRGRIDTLEDMVKNLNHRLSNITSDHLTPLKEDEL